MIVSRVGDRFVAAWITLDGIHLTVAGVDRLAGAVVAHIAKDF